MFRKISESDKSEYMKMAEDFYSSEAVCHNIPKKYIEDTFEEVIKSEVYTECYIFEYDEKTAGYALLAKTFSQEAGGLVIWIEEIYVKEKFRSKGIGREFFYFLEKEYAGRVKRFRLEAEENNKGAVKLYKNLGFEELEYVQYIKEKF